MSAPAHFCDDLDADAVVFFSNGLFEFACDVRDNSDAVTAVIIPCRDINGDPLDIAAWDYATGALATLHGRAWALGENQINEPRIECDGLHAFPSPREWLKAGRRGIVIIDQRRARWRLAGQNLVVSDPRFGRWLREILRLPEPRIFVDAGRAVA